MHREPPLILGDELADNLGLMRRQAIPEKNKRFSAVPALEIAENEEQFFLPHAPFRQPSERGRSSSLRIESDQPGGGDPFPAASRSDYGCLPFKAPGPNRVGTVGKTRFIKKAKGYVVFQAPFLISRQVFWRHIRIARSSRSTALLTGFWHEKPSRFRTCQTLRS